MITWFLICPHGDLLLRLAQGWEYCADLGPTHGHWSTLLRWPV